MPSGSVSMWLTVQGGFTVSVWLVSPAQGGAGTLSPGRPGRMLVDLGDEVADRVVGHRGHDAGVCRGSADQPGNRRMGHSADPRHILG